MNKKLNEPSSQKVDKTTISIMNERLNKPNSQKNRKDLKFDNE